MAQGLPRSRFNGSRLVQLATGLTVSDLPESKQPFAERLGQWLTFADALSLFSALNAGKAGASAGQSPAPPEQDAALRKALARVRETVVDAITCTGVPRPGMATIEWPAPAPITPAEGAPDFAPYHRYHLAHQRDMSTRIGPLRASARAALSRQSPRLGQLAALDAVLDQALASRERDLLATLPALLARRFERLYQAHRATLAETGADDPGRWMQPGGWLALFRGEMQAILLAELDLRLQPVAGLITALECGSSGRRLDNEVIGKQ